MKMIAFVIAVLLAAFGASISAGQPMPNVASLPYQYPAPPLSCGDRTVAYLDYHNEETLGTRYYYATAWFWLDGGPKQDSPFAVVIYGAPSVPPDQRLLFYISFNRDGVADRVGYLGELAVEYHDNVCELAEQIK